MIAISYRRDDSLPITGRLYDRLQARFGKREVFMDFDSIPPGIDFREQIKRIIEAADVVVAVIGPNWFGEKADGSRRIDDPTDFVRLEVECALKRDIPVIPLLINNTPMPSPETLPREIAALAYRNALPLDSGLDFHNHAERLMSGVHALIHRRTTTGPALNSSGRFQKSLLRWATVTVVIFCVAGAGWVFFRLRTAQSAGGSRQMKNAERAQKEQLVPEPQTVNRAASRSNPSPEKSPTNKTSAEQSALTPATPKSGVPSSQLSAAQDDFKKAMELLVGLNEKRINKREAMRLVASAAEQHLPEAEAWLAFWTHGGFGGLTKDKSRASELAKQALTDGLERRAESQPPAQEALGLLYEFGLVPGKAPSDAAELYQKAADQGDPIAQTRLGLCYGKGIGVFQDFNKAVELYQKAAGQGSAIALNALGWAYQNGHGVSKDMNKAVELYRKAVDSGSELAEVNLGLLYENGAGVPKDLKKAAELFQKAADQGDAAAQNNLGWLYQNGTGLPKDPDKAAELYQKAADQGNSRAQVNLGLLYKNGMGVRKDLNKAAELFQKAAEVGDAGGQNDLALLYENGTGVPKDLKKAVELLQKAADQGNANAQVNLGFLYKNGMGLPKDTNKALELFQKGAEQGNSNGQNSLGVAYATGWGVSKDLGKAAELFRKAADQGNPVAQKNLGMAYETGAGVSKDLRKAAELYRKAADQGNTDARARLDRLQKKNQ